MANTFKNAVFNTNLAADTDSSALATVAANTQTTLIGMTIANITSGVIAVDVIIENASTSPATRTHVVKAANIPVGSSLLVAGGDQKIVLWYHDSNGDQLIVRSNTLNSTNIVLSYLEST